MQSLYVPVPPLVPLGNSGPDPATVTPAGQASGPSLELTPKPEKTDTPNSDEANPDDVVTPDKSAKDGTDAPDATLEPTPD